MRVVCKYCDPLCTILTNMMLESHSWGETWVAKAIGDELQATKMDGAAWSEADADQVVAVGNKRKFW
jgi:hypothetical protein